MSELAKSFDEVLGDLDPEAKRTILLEVEEAWRVPPMTRLTAPGDDDVGGFLSQFPSLVKTDAGAIDIDKIDKMMSTGQIAYPMALKKSPITSIVRSPSGFDVICSDERVGDLFRANMQDILAKRIDEILTFLEYGAYYGEVTYEIGWPQDYGLPKSTVPFWTVSDFNGCHPSTISKIKRTEDRKRFDGFIQNPPYWWPEGPIVDVGVERALVIPHNGMFGNFEGQSVLEPVYVWWFWYELIWRAFLRFLQRQGVGVVLVKAPSRGRVKVQGVYVDNMQWALQTASSLHRTNYAAIPSDMDENGRPLWEIDYLKIGTEEGKQFIDALTQLSDNIKNFLLTGDKNASDGGEFEVMLDTERVLSHIGIYISNYVFPKFLMWNGAKTRKGKLDFQGANSRILPLLFKLMAVAGNRLGGDALRQVDWRMLFSKGGVPILTEEEVEEIREKELEEQALRYKAQWEKQFGGSQDEAKGQPGGEGRWASQRDKEGEAEQMEAMVEEIYDALQNKTLLLGPGQVVEVEEAGVRVSDKPINLENPWHDEEGKFSSKAERAYKQFMDNIGAHTDYARDAVKGSSFSDVVTYKPDDFGSFSSVVCAESDSKACPLATLATVAYYDRKTGKIHINPIHNEFWGKRPDFARLFLTHEAYHSRKRSDGSDGVVVTGDTESPEYMTKYHVEEGTVEMLSRHELGFHEWNDIPGQISPVYTPQMAALASIAAIASNWDLDGAWEIIDQLNYHINDPQYLFDLMAKVFGGEDWDYVSTRAMLEELMTTEQGSGFRALGWMFSEKVGWETK